MQRLLRRLVISLSPLMLYPCPGVWSDAQWAWSEYGPLGPDCVVWLRFPNTMLAHGSFALFHTISDMMSVILRIDAERYSGTGLIARIVRTPLSPLITTHPQLATMNLVCGTVWHIGCLESGCEGLRVLGTWKKPGWGLGITEIGRTGIFSPHK